uniref:Uncharacterized protein n=1 Tax=Anopheles atroparvus TaxID=41427 RepID=A0A182ILF3_ANOAO
MEARERAVSWSRTQPSTGREDDDDDLGSGKCSNGSAASRLGNDVPPPLPARPVKTNQTTCKLSTANPRPPDAAALNPFRSATVAVVGIRCLELLEQAVAQERRMSGSNGDVNVSFVEIGDLCFATKVNDKQIIFCNNQPSEGPTGDAGGVRKGPELSADGSVPRQFSTGADRDRTDRRGQKQTVAERIVAAVGVADSELVDYLYLAADGRSWLRQVSDTRLRCGPTDGFSTASHFTRPSLAVPSQTVTDRDERAAVKLTFDCLPRKTGAGAKGSEFEQFCVKCRVYLLEHFNKFRVNVGVMSRALMARILCSRRSGWQNSFTL